MITIIDYNLGDINNLLIALTDLRIKYKVTKNENDIIGSDKIILPGTEEAFSAVRRLHLLNLFTVLRIIKKPVLGIGLGMQLLSDFSKEGDVACLGKFSGIVEKFDTRNSIVPFSGNFSLKMEKDNLLFKNIDINSQYSFRNSYYLPIKDYTLAVARNGIDFSAAIYKDNFYGVQFHPEESGEAGLHLLKNFSDL